MANIVSVEQMRTIEAAADAAGMRYATLMQKAGHAAAARAVDLIVLLEQPKVTVLIGNGNNGGDGLVTAHALLQKRSDALIRCYLLNRREESDPVFKAAQEAGLFMAFAEDDRDNRVLRNMVASADLVIDALFGIGVRLPVTGEALKILRGANQALRDRRASLSPDRTHLPSAPMPNPLGTFPLVLALDCPSGLDCDTGEIDKNAIAADETITFIGIKTGLTLFPGASNVGRLSIAEIDIPETAWGNQSGYDRLIDGHFVKSLLPERPVDGNKGTFGKTLIIAGSTNYSGAAGLAAQAAYRAGAGLVTVGAPGPVVNVLAGALLEPTWLMLPHDMGVLTDAAAQIILEQIRNYDSVLLGPGWGQEAATGEFLRTLLEKTTSAVKHKSKRAIGFAGPLAAASQQAEAEHPTQLPPVILDADALNLLAKTETWWKRLPEGTLITPHPGEMARLAGMQTADVQANRPGIAREKAAEWNVTIVLKGAHTIIAAPGERLAVLPFKNPALATAGTGDVLAGIITGLSANGIAPYSAAIAGGYIHGLAGEYAAQALGNGRSVMAGDVLTHIADALTAVERA